MPGLRFALGALTIGLASAVVIAQDPPARRLRPLRVDLPLTPASICVTAPMWGGAAGQLVGVECEWEPVAQPREADRRVVRELDLTGLEAGPSLDLLMAELPAYDTHRRDQVTVFRPKRRDRFTTTMLDVVVARFTLKDASLVEAAEAVNRLFDPSYRLGTLEAAGPRSAAKIEATSERARALIEKSIEKYNERFAKRITMDLAGATVEEILTAISRQAGESWRVMYIRPGGRYEDSLIEFLISGEPLRTGPARVARKGPSR